MRQHIGLPILMLFLIGFTSCGGKKTSADGNADPQNKDTNAVKQTSTNTFAQDTMLSSLKPLLEKGLDKWIQSFPNFHIDSFRQSDIREFQVNDYREVSGMGQFYALYQPSLSYSPDSSQFIDLYSSGISLEKKGKKIIAIGDVDQAVTLCNLKTKSWKSIISFGPSAGMEEVVWISPVKFILAGTMQNDEGKHQPVLLLGNTEERSFRWFEANLIRNEASKYEASGLSKLKIDEWE